MSVSVCLSMGSRGSVGFSVLLSVYLSLRPRVMSLFLSVSLIHSWPPPIPHLSLFLPISPPQVDPGPREGHPPGLAALSRAPQPPPPAPRHEPPLPKNQAGVEAAQGGGDQEEVRLCPGLPPRLPTSVSPLLSHIPSAFLGSNSLVISLISRVCTQYRIAGMAPTLSPPLLLAQPLLWPLGGLPVQEHLIGLTPSPKARVTPS